LRGTAYGLRQSIDTVGAFTGPALAILFMALFDDDIRAVFWIATIPAAISVAIICFFVRDAEQPALREKAKWHFADARLLPKAFWGLITISGVFTLARFSEAFLILRATDAGMANGLAPFVLVAMNLAYALSSYPAGVLSDRLNRTGVLAAGFAVLIGADIVLAFGEANVGLVLLGVALWGLHMGLTQGLLAAMVADLAPLHLRGTAFGLFNLVVGIVTLIGSAMAGLLWESIGPWATFAAGGLFALVSLLCLPLFKGRLAPSP
jgi:MFS family permease